MKHSPILFLVILLFTACGYKDAQQADQKLIDQLMAERQSEVAACFEAAVKTRPQLEGGKMTVRAKQHIDGQLHSTQLIRGFSGSNEVFDCVAEKVNSWKTEPPKTWGAVELTFEFKNYNKNRMALSRDFGTAMNENHEAIGACFRREVAANPQIEGGEIRFKVLRTKDGRIRNIERLKGFEGDARVFSCMEDIVARLELAPAPADSSILWTQNFRRDNSIAEQPRPATEMK